MTLPSSDSADPSHLRRDPRSACFRLQAGLPAGFVSGPRAAGRLR
ncbi:hypothetical protein [Deinococcus wulumuqiensis]|nr:hypothetical protein [Deinococcus wulumuqiensis]